jgi:hypothetical protein
VDISVDTSGRGRTPEGVTRRHRPMLLPGLRPLWRTSRAVQLGTDPARAVILELADPSAGRLLYLLDGSRTEHVLLKEAARLGMTEPDARTLLEDLKDRGLVVAADGLLPPGLTTAERERLLPEAAALALDHAAPADILRQRGARRVVISGHGRLARLVEQGLREAGVGRVAVQGTLRRLLPQPEGPRVRVASASLHVAITSGRLPEGTTRPLLLISVREGVVTLGPLVPARQGPCLRCLDLHRTDRDPAWPRIQSQLPDESGACSSATAYAAAAYAVAEALAVLDGAPPLLLGESVDIHGPHELRRRRWERHPGCGCPP